VREKSRRPSAQIDVRGQNPKVVGEIWPRQHQPEKVLDYRQQSMPDVRAENAACNTLIYQ